MPREPAEIVPIDDEYFKVLDKSGNDLTKVFDEGAQLSFGDRKAKTTQPFFVDKILDGGVWDDVKGQGIVEDGIWMSREYVDGIAGKLRTHFETWLRLTPKADYDRSDIFHMFCAAMTVASFFRHDGHADPDIFAHKFLSEVRFLPNIVEDTQKTGTSILEAEVFSKINGFRVPLDGADLLSDREEEKLLEKLDSMSQKHSSNIVLLTNIFDMQIQGMERYIVYF